MLQTPQLLPAKLYTSSADLSGRNPAIFLTQIIKFLLWTGMPVVIQTFLIQAQATRWNNSVCACLEHFPSELKEGGCWHEIRVLPESAFFAYRKLTSPPRISIRIQDPDPEIEILPTAISQAPPARSPARLRQPSPQISSAKQTQVRSRKLVGGARVVPEKLLSEGFQFQDRDLECVLKNEVSE